MMSVNSNCFLLAAFVLQCLMTSMAASKNKIIVYWGQNSAGTTPSNYEKSLGTICSQYNYDTIIVSFLNVFFDSANSDRLPSINLSYHCTTTFGSSNHTGLLHCPTVSNHIKICQGNGIKVMLSLGGAAGAYGFTSNAQAREFANTIWDMFLGGNSETYSEEIRPFGDVILDGIDLDIEGGLTIGYVSFVTKLRSLMNSDTRKTYYISGAPQCPYPDAYLGPSNGTVLSDAVQAIDFLSVQFYNNYCNYSPSKKSYFIEAWNKWKKLGENSNIKIYLGLLAQKGSRGYVERDYLRDLLEMVKDDSAFGGVMIWDASWDQNNLEEGKIYSLSVHSILNN